MVRTLRITSMISIIAAVAGVLFVLVFGFKPNAQIKAFLSQPSIVEQMKKKADTVSLKEDKISPLVTQAMAFALRINPPPPLPPPPPPPQPTQRPPEPVQVATQVVTPPLISAKFNLIATARYQDYPNKSMALLNLVSEGYKWYRQGEKIGRLTIHEIKDGSIVLYQNEVKNTELFVPSPTPIKSLLKSDRIIPVSRGPSSITTVTASEPIGTAVVQPQNTSPVQAAVPFPAQQPASQQTVVPSLVQPPVKQQETTGSVRIPRSTGTQPASVSPTIPPPRQPEPEPTPEEQKQELQKSINEIKQMIAIPTEGVSQAQHQEDVKIWKELLDVLEKEKQSMEQNPDGKVQNTAEKEKTNKK